MLGMQIGMHVDEADEKQTADARSIAALVRNRIVSINMQWVMKTLGKAVPRK
ncbi:hypothetical protein [Paenibacillus planticolens]|uniref:hypothetical protein n=1 Tax=Paenibacillus planticolens TaxID=2654976 RepID=UPI0014926905|nr:hypothetical protein [Paenibacillus planticolens]